LLRILINQAHEFWLLWQVNGVLTAIRRRKSRDTIIVGSVASLCTILILLYWLTK
jgi:hypothetical protein